MSAVTLENTDIDSALAEARAEFTRRNPESLARYTEACATMPGGNTRTVLFFEPYPLTIARGAGQHLWDIDGHRYVDVLGEYTAGLYGHSHPRIRRALDEALDGGWNFGGHNQLEAKLSKLVCDRFPSVELVRFTNSGTEANLMTLSAVRAVTGRKKILVFDGGYHGGVFLFSGGGSPINAPFDWLVGQYNDIDGTRTLIEANAAELAAVILEPMIGGGGCIPATREFLVMLREVTRAKDVFLIFDEVMTSRLSPGGLQQAHGVIPDMTTLGKYIGGGMSFGAFGGTARVMERFDPRRKDAFGHAGTFNNNVLTMSAGIAALSEIYTPEAALALNARGDKLRERLNDLARSRGARLQFTGRGSMMNAHFTLEPIGRPADAAKGDMRLRDLLFFDLLARGYWLARRGMINLSLPLTDGDLDGLVDAVGEFLEARRSLVAA